MFKNPRNQGIFLVALFSFVFTSLEYPKAFKDRLEHLAETHSNKGIRAVEYGIIGEVLFWALQQCLGPEGYPLQVHGAWVKLFSAMLKVIVPKAVHIELRDKSGAQKRRACTFETYAYDESHEADFASPQSELEKKLTALAVSQSEKACTKEEEPSLSTMKTPCKGSVGGIPGTTEAWTAPPSETMTPNRGVVPEAQHVGECV
jgi:hypothetical protein